MPEGLDFKAKWGALPVWAWGAIAGVVVLVGYFVYARFSGNSTNSPDTTATASTLDAMGYQTSGIKGGSATTETTVPENNVSWLARVSRAVSDTLAASPSEVYAALYKYVTGQTITTKEKAYVDKAIQIGMSPPEGTQGISGVNDPKPPEPTNKDKARAILDRVFGGKFTDAEAKMGGYAQGTVEESVTNWAILLDAGQTENQIESSIRSGATYKNWLKIGDGK